MHAGNPPYAGTCNLIEESVKKGNSPLTEVNGRKVFLSETGSTKVFALGGEADDDGRRRNARDGFLVEMKAVIALGEPDDDEA